LRERKGQGAWRLFLEQFADFIIWVLIGAALVSGLLREWVDALAILGIVVLNAILGFVQEYRAEKSLAALRKLASPMCKALRDGACCGFPPRRSCRATCWRSKPAITCRPTAALSRTPPISAFRRRA